jgi:hypothetical protein
VTGAIAIQNILGYVIKTRLDGDCSCLSALVLLIATPKRQADA